jgi:Bacterial alpha-L-rhamnosidase C-terminal domain/Bacterial alpha-L-rhamnosidase 6 hairpin glycosidase domain
MRHPRGRARAAWLLVVPTAAVLLGGLAAAPAHADPHDNPGSWQSYLEQPATSNVRAVSATVLSGSVSNARGLTPDGHGDTTLTVASAGNPATVLLDYGVDVEGAPYLGVESFSGTAPAVSLAFTEAKTYLRTPGSSTLAAASAAGATAISVQPGTPRSPLTFAAGDTVTVGSPTETDTIVSVSGATLTLKAPLADAHPAGATVTSAPGAITGDSAFQPRQVSLTVTANGTLTSGLMGGFRFEAITLTTPGTLVLRGAGVQFGDGYLAKASDYQGYFLSSSRTFNTMYYDGAYTEQTDMQPAGTSGATQPSVLDGAKRDRAIWSGDLKIEGQGIADTLGSNGANYVKQSLLTLITSSKQGSGINADTLGRTGPYSNSYSSWTLDAATTYYRNTGDTAFAQQILPWLEGQLAYDATLTDSDGLIVTGPQISTTDGGYDWDFYDGAKTGVVTAFNDLYYQALGDVAYIEASLGNTAKAAAYNQAADHVRDAINANLLNPATGTYYLSESDHSTFAQDANALSVLFGIAPAGKVPGILSALKTLWGPHGSVPFSGTTYSNLISPYITAYEVEADYLAGDTAGAEHLMHLTWNQMIDPQNPFFTGTMWENIGPDGTATEARTSLAHGWASGPTPILTGYVLGVQPVNPGYQTFTVAPHFGSLRWAEGAVPTPYGRIFARWTRDGHRFSLTVAVPARTTAFIDLPGGHHATVAGGPHGTERTFAG